MVIMQSIGRFERRVKQVEKQYYSISELVKMGYSKDTLYRFVHIKGFPHMRTAGRGKILIDPKEMRRWMKKKNLIVEG